MKFIDEVKLFAKAGKGGNGIVAWRREKFVPRGGPAGGDGGNGGNVVFVADDGLHSLLDFRYKSLLEADSGENGRSKNQFGAAGEEVRKGYGRHTTSVSTLHNLPPKGEIIDTPGVRDFRPAYISKTDLAHAFVGFEDALAKPCKFRDCLHTNEPGCQVLQAFKQGQIDERRIKVYWTLLSDLSNPPLQQR